MFERLKKIEGIEPLRYVGYGLIDNFVLYDSFIETDWDVDENIYFFVPFTSGSDYSGSTVTLANYRAFKDYDVDWVHFAYGGHSTYAVVINANKLCDSEIFDEIIEILEGLEDYPIIDEDLLYKVEAELIESSWDGWAKADFKIAIEKKFPLADFNFPDDDIRDFFEKKREEANECWVCDGSGPDMSIDIESIVDKIVFEDVKMWATKYVVWWNDCGENKRDYYVRTTAEIRVVELKRAGFHATII